MDGLKCVVLSVVWQDFNLGPPGHEAAGIGAWKKHRAEVGVWVEYTMLDIPE